eukprot:12180273-Ditylum_brightwellii.AAC.2
MAELKTDVDNLVTATTVKVIKDFKMDMDNYFQTVVMKSLKEQIRALCQEMMQQFEFIKIQTAPPVTPLPVHTGMLTQSPSSTKHTHQIAANAMQKLSLKVSPQLKL